MSESIHIRAATEADAEGIARVHIETWQATYAGVLPDSYLIGMSQADMARQMRANITAGKDSIVTLVAERRGVATATEILGFGSAGAARDVTLLYDGEIYTLYVSSDWQGQGVGKLLLGALFRTLFERGMEDAMLWVLSANPSRFFYQHMGGVPIGQRRERLAGQTFPALAYGWPDLEAWLKQVGV
jgi:ribosomal protein S18 acetylase RimI-like enzyme